MCLCTVFSNVEMNVCETDFKAKTPFFQQLTHDWSCVFETMANEPIDVKRKRQNPPNTCSLKIVYAILMQNTLK